MNYSEFNNKRILVTGAAGFIGSNITKALVENSSCELVLLDNLSTGFYRNISPYIDNPRVRFVEGDIRDLDICMKAMGGVDYVLHQAALGSVPRSIEDPITSNEVNVSGFLNVLMAARENGVQRVVYASSSSVYGDNQDEYKIEHITGNSLSPYAVTKEVNELYGGVIAKLFGLEVIGLRYFNIFGPHQSPEGPYAAVIPIFVSHLLEDKAPHVHGDGEQTRDFTFVDNAVQANLKALLADGATVNGQVFNIACGAKMSINEIYKIISSLLNKNIEPEHTAPRAGDVRNSLADISKAKELLNYNPVVTIESGLEKTVNWYLENRKVLESE